MSQASLKQSKEKELNPGAEGPFPGSVPPRLDAVFAWLPTIVAHKNITGTKRIISETVLPT